MRAIQAHPDKSLSYSSQKILERRRRLLKEARKIIAEDGLENFSVRTLCDRAGVAQRTFYNAFSSRDRLIAIAIREAFDEFQTFISYRTDPMTLEGIIDRVLSTNRRNLKIRNYTQAIVSIYFFPTTPHDIWSTIQDMAVSHWRVWLEHLRNLGELREWVDIDEFLKELSNIGYCNINDWCSGRLPDERYLPAVLVSTLTLIVGVTKGSIAQSAEVMLSEFRRSQIIPSFPIPLGLPPSSINP